MSDDAKSLFAFGCGYVARHLAAKLLPLGWSAAGTVRTEAALDILARDGVAGFLFAPGRPLAEPAAALARASHVLISIPPDAQGDPVLAAHRDDIVALERVRWIGYLSTTGVYGDAKGGWVDEESPIRPQSERGERRAAAEAAWLALLKERGLPVHVFRLPGLYGPGRSALDKLRAGEARRVVKPGQVFSRIHVEDLVEALVLSMEAPSPGAIYNVADDEPAPPEAVVEYAARLLGVAPPPAQSIDDAELSPMARSFYAESKRVSNRRIKEALGFRPRYPSYREGLAALARKDGL